MARAAGQHSRAFRHGDAAALIDQPCALRDELHRLAAEVAEDFTTPERSEDVSVLLGETSVRLHGEGRRYRRAEL